MVCNVCQLIALRTYHMTELEEKAAATQMMPRLKASRPSACIHYTRYPIVARRAWPTGCSAFRPSASREQRYLAYKPSARTTIGYEAVYKGRPQIFGHFRPSCPQTSTKLYPTRTSAFFQN